MTQLIFKNYYKQFGIRRLYNLLSPRLNYLTSLPRDSIFHHITDSWNKDIDMSLLFLKQYNKRILVDYAETLTSDKGSPKLKPLVLRNIIRPFHIEHKTFKYVKNHYETVSDPLTLLIVNYNYLDILYRYIELPMTMYYRWYNKYATLFTTIDLISQKSKRSQFLFVKVPEVLPALSLFKIFSNKTNIALTKIFNSNDKLVLLELWKWLDINNRQNSLFSLISDENISNVNLIFINPDNKCCILNLGYLNNWIKGVETEDSVSVSKMEPIQLQKFLLKFMMTLQESYHTIDEETLNDLDDEYSDQESDGGSEYEDNVEQKDIDEEKEVYYEDVSDDSDLDYNYELTRTASKKTPFQKEENLDVILKASFTDIDNYLDTLETLNKKQLEDQGIFLDEYGEEIEGKENLIKEQITKEQLQKQILTYKTPTEELFNQIDKNIDLGSISGSEYKKILKDIDKYKDLKDPYGSGKKLIEELKITNEDLKLDHNKVSLTDNIHIVDKSMLESTLMSFDHDYINKIMKKDILSMVDNIQRSGIIIKKYEIEEDNSLLGAYEAHTLELKPIDGQPSTIRFKIPKVSEDGVFIAGGNKYILRKQRIDNPIRKIKPDQVSLTSYYGKIFINRTNKKANSSFEWICKEINKNITSENPVVTDIAPANVYSNTFNSPFIYGALSSRYKSFTIGNYHFNLDYTDRVKFVKSEDELKIIETDGSRIIGIDNDTKLPIVINKDNDFYLHSNDGLTPIGSIFTLLQVNMHKCPLDYSEIKIFSKSIPVCFFIGYFIGFTGLLKLLDIKYRTHEGRIIKDLKPDEFVLSFYDINYIFNRKDRLTSMVIGGFTGFSKELKKHPVKDFEHRDIYFNLMTSKGLGAIYIRELSLTNQLFIDSITKSILEEMGEPTTFIGLLIRASELLDDYNHYDPQDMRGMRIRGYERISGMIYKELTRSIRDFKNRNISGRSKVEMSPYKIWQTIMKDPTKKIPEDINPIQNIKEVEVVTYVGEGGRSKDSMNKPTRAYHKQDMGIVSEATIDSSDVGINAYLSPNPQFSNLRGVPKVNKDITPTSLLSTSALLAPFAYKDDPKRVNFCSIQNSHTVATIGYRQPYLRTGYEYVIGQRTSDMFCYSAKKPGKVLSKKGKGIIVEYDDGEKRGVELGRVYGASEGSLYPHDIVSSLNVGDTFAKGDIIAYNTGFFEPDILDPRKVIFKTSMVVKTALYESSQTFEDSSSISRDLGKKLTTKTTKLRNFVVKFTDSVLNVVQPGSSINAKDILLTIEDEITSTTNVFDEDALNALRNLSKQSPKSKYTGTVDKIEVRYYGDKSDMSSSLLSLVEASDKQLLASSKASNKPLITGEVNSEYRVSGKPLALDSAEIRIYITIETPSGVGDKGIFASQMKSVFGEVMDYDMITKSGDKIDAVFGYKSILNRIVQSPIIIGTTITLLKIIGKKAVEIYKG